MKLFKITHLFFGLMAALALQSCDGLIYQSQGDCDPHYKVRFRFIKHLKSPDPNVDVDAFASEVNAVTLYVVDEATGKVVWSKSETGDAVKSDSYLMDLPVNPGRYHLVAWCGEGIGPDFFVNDTDDASELSCHLIHNDFSRADGQFHVNRDLGRLYHGRSLSQDLPESEGTHIYNVDLTKNTNDVNVVLQQIGGEAINKNMFEFSITDGNHVLDWANAKNIDPSESITYHAHFVSDGSADIEIPEHGTSAFNAVVAELTVSRLFAEHKDSCFLTVKNKQTGEVVFSVPLIQYALLVKGHYKHLDDQDYLDRQDKYDLIFFLDEGHRWINAYIYINSWKVVIQNDDL